MPGGVPAIRIGLISFLLLLSIGLPVEAALLFNSERTEPLTDPRAFHTLTLLPDGRVLAAGGVIDCDSSEVFNPLDGTWTPAGNLNECRRYHTATILPDGRVLVAGGENGTAALDSAEVFDPATGLWSVTGSMNAKRQRHSAVSLEDGRVLVTGGVGVGATFPLQWWEGQQSAEIFDPATGTWTPVGDMAAGRMGHSLSLLQDGSVLAAGGASYWTPTASCERFDPNTLSWTSAGSLNFARFEHTATVLPDGHVLVATGHTAWITGELDSAELYDPVGNSWSVTDSPSYTGRFATAALLADGRVLAAGAMHYDSGSSKTKYDYLAEIYDPNLGRWIDGGYLRSSGHLKSVVLANGDVLFAGGYCEISCGTPGATPIDDSEIYHVPTGRWGSTKLYTHTGNNQVATQLRDGRILVTGGLGDTLRQPMIYDPFVETWSLTGALNYSRFRHTATLLADGRVLVVGGNHSPQTAEIFDPTTLQWSVAAQTLEPRDQHTATLLPGGSVLVCGGAAPGSTGDLGAVASCEEYDPSSDAWSPAPSLGYARRAHKAVRLKDGRVLVAGGLDSSYYLFAPAEIFDPVLRSWSSAGGLKNPIDHTMTLMLDGRVLVAGGWNGQAATSPIPSIYSPGLNSWREVADLHVRRRYHTATLLPSGKIVVAGGWPEAGGSLTVPTEVFDPATETWNQEQGINRKTHVAARMPDGTVLVSGGYESWSLNYSQRFDPYSDVPPGSRPVISHLTRPLIWNTSAEITGSGFRPAIGSSNGSSTVPVVTVSILGEEGAYVVPSSSILSWSDTTIEFVVPSGLGEGIGSLTVSAHGIPSAAAIARVLEVCTGDPECDDGDPCTVDLCDMGAGTCSHDSDDPTWYRDSDGDGHGDPNDFLVQCDQPAGYVLGTSDDCDDTCSACYPGATEECSALDNDCDGQTDNVLQTDLDADGTDDGCDNCPGLSNPMQEDGDGDSVGDLCDNCVSQSNPGQEDLDQDSIGDACDSCPNDPNNDSDSDGVCGDVDNCDGTPNSSQSDQDLDGMGDLCDVCPLDPDNDLDGDSICGDVDTCPGIQDPLQEDADLDGYGDPCDNCPQQANPSQLDGDSDLVGDECDNCRAFPNPNQDDTDLDGVGDACDVLITAPLEGETLDCAGSIPPTISWSPGMYERFKVYISWTPSFSKKKSSGKKWLEGTSWSVPSKKWDAACKKANKEAADLYIMIKSKDNDAKKTDATKKTYSQMVSVHPQY